jgi:hypothetical protein
MIRPVRAALVTVSVAVTVCVSFALGGLPTALSVEPAFTRDQMREFLLAAEIVASQRTGKGITSPYRLTLSDGTVTHDAAFQVINEHKLKNQFADGRVELNFVDSYKYDIAAYRIAELIGLDGMMPVTVERTWRRQTGALSWWVPTKMDESERLKKKIEPPAPDDWNRQMHRMRLFAALVYDTDRNLTNVLIDEDWKLWMIDFSRAFRVPTTLVNEKDLVKADRALLSRLEALDGVEVARATRDYLTRDELDGVMKRRDRIVDHFNRLVAIRGERDVLY